MPGPGWRAGWRRSTPRSPGAEPASAAPARARWPAGGRRADPSPQAWRGRLRRRPSAISVADPPPSRLIASRAPSPIIRCASSGRVSPASSSARPSQATAIRSVVVDPQGGARMAAVGDVRVELAAAGGEALAIVAGGGGREAPADQEGPRLEQVPGRNGRQVGPPGELDALAVDGHARPHRVPGRLEGRGRAPGAADPELAERGPHRRDEEPAHEGVGRAGARAPAGERLGRVHRDDPEGDPRAFVDRRVHRREPAVGEGVTEGMGATERAPARGSGDRVHDDVILWSARRASHLSGGAGRHPPSVGRGV